MSKVHFYICFLERRAEETKNGWVAEVTTIRGPGEQAGTVDVSLDSASGEGRGGVAQVCFGE